ncbi:MAG: hypothetical protein AAFY60_20995, partial [Myxococcota bacterium]
MVAPNEAIHVPVSTEPQFRIEDFGSGVDLSSIQVTVNGSPLTPTITGSPSSALVRWSGPLDYGTDYLFSVSAQDLAGNPMMTATPSFTTDPGLLVTSASPVPGASGISVDTRISLTVEALGERVIDIDSVRLRVNQGEVLPTQTGTPTNLVLDYAPSTPLAYGSTARVTLDLRDERGNAIPQYALEFDTAPDTTAPQITNQSPAPDSTGVSADTAVSFTVLDTESGVDVNALEAIVDGDFYALGDPGFFLAPVSGGVRVTVTPPLNAFSAGDEILVAITALDTAGNRFQSAYAFNVGNESDPPLVTIVAPD